MPHIIIEHDKKTTHDVNLKALSQNLHDYFANFETVVKTAIRTRTIEAQNVVVGIEGQSQNYIHITILLMKGRPEELKQKMAKSVFDKTQELVASPHICVTVEIRELGTYCKE